MLFTLCHTWNSPSDITGILPLRSSPINIYSTTSYSYSPDKDDRKVKHHSLKPHTIQPVTDHEEDPVQGSGTGRMKRQFDFSSEKHILLHLAETSQEAMSDCGLCRRGTGSRSTNGCLHNLTIGHQGLDLTHTHTHPHTVIAEVTCMFFSWNVCLSGDISSSGGCGWIKCWLSIVILC